MEMLEKDRRWWRETSIFFLSSQRWPRVRVVVWI